MLILLSLLIFPVAGENPRVPLVIAGIDGFGYELLSTYGNISSVSEDGTIVRPIRTVFPSKTFPNFFSIATGLYPTQHGIVGNKFYNRKEEEEFSYEDDQAAEFSWYKGEPFWITAKKQGLRVYCDMWVGSAASFDGVRPDKYSVYDNSKTWEEKVEGVTEAIGAGSYDLYVLYTNEPDWTLHRSDMTNKTLVGEIVQDAEAQIELLKDSLEGLEYNLIIVSDHGLTSYDNKYNIAKDFRDRAFKFYGGAVSMWYPKRGKEAADEALKLNQYFLNNSITGAEAFQTSDLPPRFQMCGAPDEGLPDVLLIQSEHVGIGVYDQKSGHGWDNLLSSMNGQLRMWGPAFKAPSRATSKATSEDTTSEDNAPITTPNTEIYNLVCAVLGIKPVDNTGALDTFDAMLVSPPDRDTWEYSRLSPPCTSHAIRVLHWTGSIILISLSYLFL